MSPAAASGPSDAAAVRVRDARFLTSAAAKAGWPETGQPEVAFCGRSNVGKSTLLNALLGRRGMARVSRTPGRTRLVNFFAVELSGRSSGSSAPELVLADLPGFGYARVSKAERSTWRPLIESYLVERRTLKVVCLLCDSRRALDLPQEPAALHEEAELCRFLLDLGREVVPVMTKADKLSKHERKPAAEIVRRLLGRAPVIFSALSGEGTAELWRRVLRGFGG